MTKIYNKEDLGISTKRIKSIAPKPEYKLEVIYEDGSVVLYDVKDDIDTIDAFRILESEPGLFESVQLDESGTCVYWNDDIDLASDTIYEYGEKIASNEEA